MNKANLIKTISVQTNVRKEDVEKVLNAFERAVIDSLKKSEEVSLVGFGTFAARKRKGRIGVDPRDPKKPITIPDVVVPKFKAGKILKDALKKQNTAKAVPPAPTVDITASKPQ